MAARKIRNTWWIDFSYAYTRYRFRSPENTQDGAKAYEAVLRQKLARGESITKIHSNPFSEEQSFESFAWKWFDEYVVPNNKQQEQRMKRYILRSSLIPFFGKTPISQITTRQIDQYKAHALKKGVSPKTVNNRLAVLGKCIRTAYEWLNLSGVMPKVALLKCPPPQTKYLSADECELLMANAEGVVWEMILTALRTGMRQGEIRGLQWSSINWESGDIIVRHSLNDRTKILETPKSNRERSIPMDSDVYDTLFRRKRQTGYVFLDTDGSIFDSQRALRRLEKIRERAGLRKFTWHTLRHTTATQLALKGAPLHVVQALLGHSTINTTMRYAHVSPSALRDAIRLLNPKTALAAGLRQPGVNTWQMTQQEGVGQQIAHIEKGHSTASE